MTQDHLLAAALRSGQADSRQITNHLEARDLPVCRTMALTQAALKAVLHYDPTTGKFTRLVDVSNHKAGEEAGCSGERGVISISIDGVLYKAHRLAWLYVHGEWPKHVIDHCNGDPADNRLSNLRDATQSCNLQNQRRARSDNRASGLLGVAQRKHTGKWIASIQVDRKRHYLGTYGTAQEAHAAYVQAKRHLHPGGML